MTNLQLLVSVGIPTLAVLISILLNNSRFSAMEQRLIVIEGDLRRFYEILGRHESEIQNLKDRLK